MPSWQNLPSLILLLACFGLSLYGPIAQLSHYHEFADQRAWGLIPNALDVLSNFGFALVGCYGFSQMYRQRQHPNLINGWPGYRLFLAALLFTAIGSSCYHWAPDNARLFWDRLPIALACAGLLAASRGELVKAGSGIYTSLVLGCYALAAVVWWYWTEQQGQGDLRPYLLLQAAPLVFIPLWQWLYQAPAADKTAFNWAIVLYLIAKVTESFDAAIYQSLGLISGHSLKHLLASLAAAIIIRRLIQRTRTGV